MGKHFATAMLAAGLGLAQSSEGVARVDLTPGPWIMCPFDSQYCVPAGSEQWLLEVHSEDGPEVIAYRLLIGYALPDGTLSQKIVVMDRSDWDAGWLANGTLLYYSTQTIVLGKVKPTSIVLYPLISKPPQTVIPNVTSI